MTEVKVLIIAERTSEDPNPKPITFQGKVHESMIPRLRNLCEEYEMEELD